MIEEKNANKVISDVKVNLGGKDRYLKFNLYALCKLKEETGKNGFDDKIWANVDPTDLRDLLWCSLITDDPELTREELSRMIEMKDLLTLPIALQKAFSNATPEAKPTDKKVEKKKV